MADELSWEIEALSNTDDVRKDCTFCGWERVKKDDNHAPNCPYWDFFGG